MYVAVLTINENLGLYFGKFAEIVSVSFLVLILTNEFVTSRLNSNRKELIYHALFYLAVAILTYLPLRFFYGSYFQPYSYPDQYDCVQSVGLPCAAIEDKGKVTAAKTKESLALMKKYGREKVTYKALQIHLAHDTEFLTALNPNYKGGYVGCVIVVTAGDEGYVMYEEKSLRVVSAIPLAQFKQDIQNSDPAIVEKFYASLH